MLERDLRSNFSSYLQACSVRPSGVELPPAAWSVFVSSDITASTAGVVGRSRSPWQCGGTKASPRRQLIALRGLKSHGDTLPGHGPGR